MADNDLQAELDNLFGDSEEKKQDEEASQGTTAEGQPAAETPSSESEEAKAPVCRLSIPMRVTPSSESEEAKAPAPAAPAAKGKPLMGGKPGAKPMGKGFPKMPPAASAPKAAPKAAPVASQVAAPAAAPISAAAVPAPAVTATSVNMNLPAAMPPRPMAGQAAAPSKLPLILSGLSLLFTLVCIFMVTQLRGKVSALQTAIEAQSRAQLDILNEQTETLRKNDKILQDQLLKKDSDFQKRMKMLMETVEEVKDLLPKK